MKLVTPVILAALVVLSMGATGTVGTETLLTDSETVPTDSAPREITECTNITEPGKYVVTQNISTSEGFSGSACIQVNASDVVIDGQGYDIDVPYDVIAISVGADDRRLSNVTVRNVEASGLDLALAAILYESVDGGTVANVTLSRNQGGVRLVNSSDISVRESTIEGEIGPTMFPSRYGVLVTNSSDTVIAANTFRRVSGVTVDGSTNTRIANNHIRGEVSFGDGDVGIRTNGTINTTVVNNTISYMDGVEVQGRTNHTVIERNNISHTENGVRISTVGSSNTGDGNETTVVGNNTITESTIGVEVDTNHGTLRIRNNELVGNDYGIYALNVEGTEDVEVDHNAIVNNSQYGIVNERSVTLNATHNYWGASSGPSSANDSDAPFEDPVTGALADGEGDAVSENPNESGISNVHFDPWLNQSAANASVGGFESPPTKTSTKTPETSATPEVTITTEPSNVSEMDLDGGTNVTLTANASDSDGNITAIEWDTDGDGEFDQSGETVTLSLDFCGELPVTVRATGDSGQSVTESVTLSTV